MRTFTTAPYPISRMVSAILQQSGLACAEFVATLGYRNSQNGLAALRMCVEEGFGTPYLLESIAAVYRPDPRMWNSALIEMKQRFQKLLSLLAMILGQEQKRRVTELERQRRACFRPFIHSETERSLPHFITGAALTGNYMKYVRFMDWPSPAENAADYAQVNGFAAMTRDEKLQVVSIVVTAHFQRHQGRCPLYGAITGYRYFESFDSSVLFDVKGRVVRREAGPHRWPEFSVKIGSKTIRDPVRFFSFTNRRQ